MDTKELILKESKNEFINKGFNNSSLRDIAKKCHISATAIYRHFNSKEELFNAVIEPLISYFNEMASYVENNDYDYLNNNNLNEMWNFEHEGCFQYKFLFGKYNDLVKLIVKERKDWFKNFIVSYEFDATIKYINHMKSIGYSIKQFNLLSFRLLLDSYLEAYLNLLNEDLKKEELAKISSEINEFYTLGFRNLLGF